WHKTRMEDPGRAERLWLVMAVATLWLVALGAEDEAREQAEAQRQRLARELGQAQQQAQARQERERLRLEKLRAALAARRAKQRHRAAARQAARQAKAGKRRQRAAGGPPRLSRVD